MRGTSDILHQGKVARGSPRVILFRAAGGCSRKIAVNSCPENNTKEMEKITRTCTVILLAIAGLGACAPVRRVEVSEGWAKNSVNVAVFRKNSLVTRGDTQYIAYYDPEGVLVLGKRHWKERAWQTRETGYRGNVADAHNVISMMVDGKGVVHVAWDHHGHPLHYARGMAPGSMVLGEKESMVGRNERNVTYPEFFRMPDGDLVFMYRDGASGNGNLVMNKYDAERGTWSRLHDNLIDGEGTRNAY